MFQVTVTETLTIQPSGFAFLRNRLPEGVTLRYVVIHPDSVVPVLVPPKPWEERVDMYSLTVKDSQVTGSEAPETSLKAQIDWYR